MCIGLTNKHNINQISISRNIIVVIYRCADVFDPTEIALMCFVASFETHKTQQMQSKRSSFHFCI